MLRMALSSTIQSALRAAGDVSFDQLTRQLYATDASIYQLEPQAVAFPRDATECARLVRAAAEHGLGVTPRGAGTGLVGGALGEGLILDMARLSREQIAIDADRRQAHVGPGVVLDRLNAAARPFGLWFGPDVATSSRATLGGMIGNDSSGAHAPVYGTTSEHVSALEVVLADGTAAWIGRDHEALEPFETRLRSALDPVAGDIDRARPPGTVKRWPGYGLESYLGTGSLDQLITGSEGTLAVVTRAVVDLVPLPPGRSLVVLFFSSIAEAMDAAVALRDLEPAAIEHIDRILLDQTRGQRAFARQRELLGLDAQPSEALLLVELFEEGIERAEAVAERGLGDRVLVCRTPAEQQMVWSVRKAGLSLLTGRPGAAKPATAIEDVCVPPHDLPEYVRQLRGVLDPLDLDASFYGHAGSGELHVRPVLDLHDAHDLELFRQVADRVSEICRQLGGSIAAEHGVGIARTEYLATHLGETLTEATRSVKATLDPNGVLNPGKIVDTGRFRIDGDLRYGADHEIPVPFLETLAFVDKDHSFIGNLEQCNGCGGCLKAEPTMCPTYIATPDEIMSTRGRANTIRAVLEGRIDGDEPLQLDELDAALSNCLSCKACKTECPSNVDLALLKAELLNARHHLHGTPLTDRVIAAADLLGRLGTAAPALANVVLGARPMRHLMDRALGFNADRPLPTYAVQRFDRWFSRRTTRPTGSRGAVLLWDDTWVRYHEPHVGQAAVVVLEAAGYEVQLVTDRKCCGRPAFSRGLVDTVRHLARHNLSLLAHTSGPIVFLEPSCYSMFIDEYRQLELHGADEVAARCVLFEDLLERLLAAEPDAVRLDGEGISVAVHGHCHAKALTDARRVLQLLERTGASARWLSTGCCGMAGAFGMLRSKDELSRQVAQPLLEQIAELDNTTRLVACGISCRHQITQLSDAHPVHIAELLESLMPSPSSAGQGRR
jgi:FAD/FMN-containing dehydrogenase/Fe-S oxidoreductase